MLCSLQSITAEYEGHSAFGIQPLELIDKDLWTMDVCTVWEMWLFTESSTELLDDCVSTAEKEFAVNNVMIPVFPHHQKLLEEDITQELYLP